MTYKQQAQFLTRLAAEWRDHLLSSEQTSEQGAFSKRAAIAASVKLLFGRGIYCSLRILPRPGPRQQTNKTKAQN